MIEATGLSKRYGKKEALRNVSFHVAEGEVVGLLGLNGAGKSTTMNILTGYIGATSGTVRIAGLDVVAEAREARRIVGYLPEQPPLYPDMTVEEYLRFVWRLYQGDRGGRRAAVEKALERTSLTHVRGRLVRNLSKGYRQRVGIAQAILPSPRVLILDEPTIGLDPSQILEVRTLVGEVARGATVILSSHILGEIQAVCSRVLVLNEGRLIADNTPQELAGLLHGGQS
ncbi:MAG TPA: ABC transporter ATP-binding protein, partial [Candidatus Limnocylindria bacterium]|nr:ABC transporter ATP-binding protein [Candidatus Limnocylindria bacterium]